MTLATAHSYAQYIVTWLTPYCDRIEIAGSIRRQRPQCNDVDLVVIPKFQTLQVDMFQTEQRSQLWTFLTNYASDPNNNAHWLGARAPLAHDHALALAPRVDISGGAGARPEGPKPTAQNLLLQLKKCQLDIFCATEATWATMLLCRTGSKEHNIWFADRAKSRGLHWNPYKGLSGPSLDHDLDLDHAHDPAPSSDPGRARPRATIKSKIPETEPSLYAALDLPYIRPQDREPHFLRTLPL